MTKIIKAEGTMNHVEATSLRRCDDELAALRSPAVTGSWSNHDELIALCMDMLGDVPGETLDQRVEKLVGYHLELQAMVGDLRAQVEGVAWRPIETAPTDGTWVLVWEKYISTKYHPAEVARFLTDRWVNSGSKHVPNVSHWMPIPALSSTERGTAA